MTESRLVWLDGIGYVIEPDMFGNGPAINAAIITGGLTAFQNAYPTGYRIIGVTNLTPYRDLVQHVRVAIAEMSR